MNKMRVIVRTAAASLFAVALWSCCGSHTVNGKFAGLEQGRVIVEYLSLNNATPADAVSDTVVAKSGKFFIDLPADDTLMVYITFPDNAARMLDGEVYQSLAQIAQLMVLPGQKVCMKGSVENPMYLEYEVRGTGFNSDYAADRASYRDLEMHADSLDLTAINLSYFHVQNGTNDHDAQIDSLNQGVAELYKQISARHDEYVKANPSTDLAAYYLLQKSVDHFGEYYPLLTPEAVNGIFAGRLATMESRYESYKVISDAAEKIYPGAQAPGFILPDMDGNEVLLSEIKGRYIVLDFWGSWCGWCIKGAPEMKAYKNKYRRITFVGIACRDTDQAWREAVAKHEMNWLQLFNPGAMELAEDVSTKYGIRGYPTKIILDSDHKIVEVFEGETPKFYAKLDELMK